MGCGYSKINISSRRGRLKERIQAEQDYDENEYNCDFSPGKVRKSNGKGGNSDLLKKNGVSNSFNSEESLTSRRRIANKIKPISGPMRPPLNRSASQVDFFKMLDEKIANGKDFVDEDDFIVDDEVFKIGNNCIHQLVPPSCPLPPPSPIEDNTANCSPKVTNKCRKNNPTPDSLISETHLANEYIVGISPSPRKHFRDVSSISIPSTRSSSANSRSLSAGGKTTHQVEAECHVNANMFNSNEDMQMNFNNYEVSKDYPVQDSADKVITSSPLHLSNGQVHS